MNEDFWTYEISLLSIVLSLLSILITINTERMMKGLRR